jgi:DNA polymerase-3 subunit delta'
MAGSKRAVIIPEAQRFCRGQAEAANAFLKTLEEPPKSALIILTSSQPEALLETIVSRVQTVQFKRLAQSDVEAGLRRQVTGLDAREAALAAAMADGSIGRAIDLARGDLKNWRAAVTAALEQFSAKTFLGFSTQLWAAAEQEGERLFAAERAKEKEKAQDEDEAAEVSDEESEAENKSEAGWTRYVFANLLSLCEVCFRDALVCAAAGSEAQVPLLQPDKPALAHALGAKFGAAGCEKALGALRESQLAARLYIRGDIVVRALAGRLREALVEC